MITQSKIDSDFYQIRSICQIDAKAYSLIQAKGNTTLNEMLNFTNVKIIFIFSKWAYNNKIKSNTYQNKFSLVTEGET